VSGLQPLDEALRCYAGAATATRSGAGAVSRGKRVECRTRRNASRAA
jgi:hypothetical protein